VVAADEACKNNEVRFTWTSIGPAPPMTGTSARTPGRAGLPRQREAPVPDLLSDAGPQWMRTAMAAPNRIRQTGVYAVKFSQ
jgi:hypothetical protein